jgi:hypothetical protein
MGILDAFKSKPFEDPALGALRYSGGRWKGTLSLPPHGTVPLLLSGKRTSPDEQGLAIARALPGRYEGMRGEIAKHFFDHYDAYRDALDDAQPQDRPKSFPRISAPNDVWPHLVFEPILIEPIEDVQTLELAYRVAWDEEHTLGAWIRDWRVFELCGSVGP